MNRLIIYNSHLFLHNVVSLHFVISVPLHIHVRSVASTTPTLLHSRSPAPRVNLVPQATRSYDIRVRRATPEPLSVIRAFLRPRRCLFVKASLS